MAYFLSVSDSEEEEDDEYLRDRMSQDADYFQNLLDSIDPHQYISLGVFLAVHVGDVLTLKEKDSNTIRTLLMKLFNDWLSRQKKEANPRAILAQKLSSIGLNSEADLILDHKTVKGMNIVLHYPNVVYIRHTSQTSSISESIN